MVVGLKNLFFGVSKNCSIKFNRVLSVGDATIDLFTLKLAYSTCVDIKLAHLAYLN